jgi:hypothetical protein
MSWSSLSSLVESVIEDEGVKGMSWSSSSSLVKSVIEDEGVKGMSFPLNLDHALTQTRESNGIDPCCVRGAEPRRRHDRGRGAGEGESARRCPRSRVGWRD